ncbi:MAG: hypothetical protein DWB59_09285 [Anaerolineae bacterium]|nr:hypothetical protein [Anaerolineae bacterium]
MTRSTTKQLQAKPVKPSRLSVALLSRAMREAAKRAFDAAAAFFGLLVLSPFFAVIAILIKRDTPGPGTAFRSRSSSSARCTRRRKVTAACASPAKATNASPRSESGCTRPN